MLSFSQIIPHLQVVDTGHIGMFCLSPWRKKWFDMDSMICFHLLLLKNTYPEHRILIVINTILKILILEFFSIFSIDFNTVQNQQDFCLLGIHNTPDRINNLINTKINNIINIKKLEQQ